MERYSLRIPKVEIGPHITWTARTNSGYDFAGWAIKMLLSDGATILQYGCDGDGRLQRLFRNALGSSLLFDGRDVIGERLALTMTTGAGAPGSGRVTFMLDNASRITGDSAGTAYSYDANGWLLGRSGGIGNLAMGA